MCKRLLIIILIILLTLLPGCLPPNRTDFQKKKYLRHNHHRRIPIFYQDQYRNKGIYKERKRQLQRTNTITINPI